MPEETKTSDSLEEGIDNNISSIGAASAFAGAASANGMVFTEAGATAGMAAGGPIGTIAGTAVSFTESFFAKPIVKALIVITVFLLMVFSSIPSMLFENPIDMADNAGPQTVYQKFKNYVLEAYKEEIENRKKDIGKDFQRRVSSGEFSAYDHVEYSYSFDPTEEVFLEEVRESCVLIITMFEVHTDDWRKASFNHFKKAVDSVNFWQNIVETEKLSETSTVTWSEGDEEEEPESTIYVDMTYRFHDKGVEQFRKKFGLKEESDYLKSVEMAYNTKVFFGETTELPMGGISGGGSGSYPGGGTHNTIRQALADLETKSDFTGGSAGTPVSSYKAITSEFGPRNYAPDPIHTGIDFSADAGTPVYAAMDGIVLLRLTNMKSFGNHIVLYHGGEVTTMYAHMSAFGSYQVGDKVKRGDMIGYVGTTGLSTGNHLHFEYQINGAAHDPRKILPIGRGLE